MNMRHSDKLNDSTLGNSAVRVQRWIGANFKLLAWLMTIVVGSFAAWYSMKERVTVLEVRVNYLERQVQDIRDDL